MMRKEQSDLMGVVFYAAVFIATLIGELSDTESMSRIGFGVAILITAWFLFFPPRITRDV